MSKSTPGPWSVSDTGRSIYGAADDFGGWPVVADICFRGDDGHEDRANARLIAAAPELLEALEKVKAGVEAFGALLVKYNYPAGVGGMDVLAKLAGEAIAKAGGAA